MRWLEVRRHSFTKHGDGRGRGSHLSAEGVALARAVGATMGPFSRVVASRIPRTLETALAMGFAVDDLVDMPSGYIPGEVEHHAQHTWRHPYCRYAELLAAGGGLAGLAATMRALFVEALGAIPDGSAALVVSHGGTIEPALVACLPRDDHALWGGPMGHCDGARLAFADGDFVSMEIRRAPLRDDEDSPTRE
jgi:broad specificity phosphatase PhoE